MGIFNHWTTVHLLFAQQTNLPFSEFQFIKVVLKLSKRQKNQRNHIRYSPQLSARVSKLRGFVHFPDTALFLPSLSTLTPIEIRAQIRFSIALKTLTPGMNSEMLPWVLGTLKIGLGNAGLVTRAQTFSLFRKSSELTQMTQKGRAGYADLHFMGNPVT